jgi:hypothetical protein
MLATPDSFRLNQNPLGAIRLPQALTTVAHIPLPGGTFASSGTVVLSANRFTSRTISFVLTETGTLK